MVPAMDLILSRSVPGAAETGGVVMGCRVVRIDADGTGRRFFIIVGGAKGCPHTRTRGGHHDAAATAPHGPRHSGYFGVHKLSTGTEC